MFTYPNKPARYEHGIQGYAVVDLETTGFDAFGADRIVEIAIVRVDAHGRELGSFSTLIHPGCEMRAGAIHHIDDTMVADAPRFAEIAPSVLAWLEGVVVVAHNAAFDMRFLQLKEESTGICFRQPVLDTLLLSAVIHPNQESHKLEAICERLGINVIGRHTALGDAIVTGEVFLKMIPLLAEMGINTLREAREAAELTYFARIKY